MDLYLIRHAIAHERDCDRWPDDSKRPLTPEGEEKFRQIAEELPKVAPAPERLFSSPFERAWGTAAALSKVCGWPEPEPLPALEPGVTPQKMMLVLEDIIRDCAGPVAVVGHRPSLHELAAYLLTGKAEGLEMKVKKGGALCVRFYGDATPGSGELRWLLTPKVILR